MSYIETARVCRLNISKRRKGTTIGDAEIFPDWLRCQPQASSVLHRAQPTQPLLRPSLIVVPEVGVEHAAEFRNRHPGPVPVVEELSSVARKGPATALSRSCWCGCGTAARRCRTPTRPKAGSQPRCFTSANTSPRSFTSQPIEYIPTSNFGD